MIELKRCPFCGHDAYFETYHARTGSEWWYVQCLKCKAATWRYVTQKDAAQEWNRRDNILKRLVRILFKLRGDEL